VTFGLRLAGSEVEVASDAADRGAKLVDKFGLDRVFDDRVTVDLYSGDMPRNLGVFENNRHTILTMDPLDNPALDNPAWHALTGPNSTLAEGTGLALRYEPDVAAFAAIPDIPSAEAWDALRELVGPGAGTALFRTIETPAEWNVLTRMQTHQMIAGAAATGQAPGTTIPLTAADGPDMLALVAKTRPGPFFDRTIELGGYLGIREHGELIAMAGQRMHPTGYTEVSAVCTLPEHRGRGLGAIVVEAVATAIRARGDTPILHVLTTNTSAIALYEKLGFTIRTTLDVTVLQAP